MKESHKIVYLDPKSLDEYENNSRTHSASQIDRIKASIQEFGFLNPILIDQNNMIIAGHARAVSAIDLGMAEVPTIQVAHLSEKQVKAYVIADNRLAELSTWNDTVLNQELAWLDDNDFDITLTGFEDFEIDIDFVGLSEDDAAVEPPVNPVSKLGNIWLLGEHRVMCGDSTSLDEVERLINGDVVDMIFTDPPYNVAFNGRSGDHDVIKNDDLPVEEFNDFIDRVILVVKKINPAIYYIWCNWKFYGVLQERLEYKACIVWAKNNFGMGIGYRHQHEFCLFNGKLDDHIKNESDLWHISKDTNYVHPTQKPVALFERAVGNHKSVKVALDLFGGSGSTLIGCEKTNKKALIMELDEKYVDVIIERWQSFTGLDALLESTGETYNELKK